LEKGEYFMQSPNVVKRKPYEQPILRELTSEQAVLFLVGHAYIGNQGAKELMEMLFPLPMDSRIARTHETREMVGRPESKGEQAVERQEIEPEDRRGKRRHRRLELEAEVTVRSESGLVPGRSLEVSESGMSAILPVELHVGEKVELQIKLPPTPATARAIVRNRNVFRHGFEFVQPLRETIENETDLGDCQSCGGTGSILQALDGERGVAFARLKCGHCGGKGSGSRQAV
jgi:hypothetical protein